MEHKLWHVADRLPVGTTRLRCPYCADSRRPANQSAKTLTVTIDGDFALYNCHHCNEGGKFSLRQEQRSYIQERHREVKLPAPASRVLTQAHVEYLSSRGISLETAVKAGVYSVDNYIRDVGNVPCLAFPYPTATKFRATHVKGFSCQGSPVHYFLSERVVETEPLIICEGELDALSMMEAGIVNATSVPNGAPQTVSNGKVSPKDDLKYRFVWGAERLYKSCKKIILATDNDEPGEALAEELARRIGKYRCYRVKFPHGLKDSNDVLVKLGPEALREIVEAAEPWPVAGLFETSHYEKRVMDLYLRGEGKGASTGLSALDGHYTVAPGQFTVVTGVPSSGKSEFIDHLMVSLASREGWSFAVCSFENPPDSHIVKLVEKRAAMPFYEAAEGDVKDGVARIGAEDMRRTVNWVGNHFYWIEQADGACSTIDDIIERCKVAIMRYGVRGVVIDPYNFIDKAPNMPETEFVSEILTKIRQLAVGHDVHVWFIAHPTKLKRDETGGYPAPGGYEISGSAAWFAKADCGLTVHRGKNSCETEIHLWKVRFKWIGKTGMVMLAYNPTTGLYTDGRQPSASDEYIEYNYQPDEEGPSSPWVN